VTRYAYVRTTDHTFVIMNPLPPLSAGLLMGVP
jgi:hypothetical protein